MLKVFDNIFGQGEKGANWLHHPPFGPKGPYAIVQNFQNLVSISEWFFQMVTVPGVRLVVKRRRCEHVSDGRLTDVLAGKSKEFQREIFQEAHLETVGTTHRMLVQPVDAALYTVMLMLLQY